jgi:hypothetical protein
MTDFDSTPELETDARFARLEGRVQALEGRIDQVLAAERARKQRAVYYRVVLLALMLLGFFALRLRQGSAP